MSVKGCQSWEADQEDGSDWKEKKKRWFQGGKPGNGEMYKAWIEYINLQGHSHSRARSR